MTTAATPRVTVRRPRSRGSLRAVVLGIVGVAALVGALEFVSRAGLVNEKFLPPFSSVFAATLGLFVDPEFLADIASTLGTWVLAMGISILIAVPLGVLLGLSEATYRASRTVIELVRTLPAVALIPLVILIVGSGIELKLVIAVYASMWPILFNTIYGVHGTDPKAVEMGRSFGQRYPAIVRRIVIPSAAPFIGTGIRISSSIALIAILTVEIFAGGVQGVGSFIAQQRILGDQVTLVYAGILVAGLLGLVINIILGALERRAFGWNATTRN